MRAPHQLFTAAFRGVAGWLGHDRDGAVALRGRPYDARRATAVDQCRVEGCGARATRVALRSDGVEIPVCARCGEEWEAVLGSAPTLDPSAD